MSFDDIFEGDSTANHPTTAVLEEIVEGPNQGYWYVAGHDYRVDRRWHVNKRLDSLKGPEELPDAANGDTVNHWTYLARRGHDPADLLAGVTAHERYGRNGAMGHQGQILKALDYFACGDAGKLAERLVTDTEVDAKKLRFEIEDAANKAFEQAAKHHKVWGNYSGRVVRYLPGSKKAPFTEPAADTQDADPRHTHRFCNWKAF